MEPNKNKFVAEIDIDNSHAMEKLHEIEITVDRIAEKVSRLKISLAQINQSTETD